MILADTNFWLALSLSAHEFHGVARHWFDQQRVDHSVLFCRFTQLSVLRLLTTDGVMRLYGVPPLTNTASWAMYDEIRSDHRSGFAEEPGTIELLWKRYGKRDSSSPKMWMDTYLAAFALAGGHKFVTTDKAFAQFKELDAIILSNEK